MRTKHIVRKILCGIGVVLLAVVVLLAGMIGFLAVTEYRPAEREKLDITGTADAKAEIGESFSVMTWNIGYGALGDNADFFMDGGNMVKTADEARVRENLDGIAAHIASQQPDVLFLQEVDVCSSRSCRVNEYADLQSRFKNVCSSFAENFKVAFLPYPVPPIGKVDSGIATFSAFTFSSAERVQLPVPFAWPMRMANLKRCLLVSRVPIAGSEKELVLVNLHLEAYDDGEGKREQTAMLAQLLEDEAARGNYVIAGGDFNQLFSTTDASAFPVQEGNWAASEIDVQQFSDTFQFLMDQSVPSCRSLYKPYAGADKDSFQYYLIDGFIMSTNIAVDSFQTQDCGFVSSDHNPVFMRVILQGQRPTFGS